ncbi:MAG: NAD(P)/FAD-dependent oxidoreductase [Congregibacter sp.]
MQTSKVVIVGAGIVGLSIAWQLCRRGFRDIVVLEKGAGIGEGSTGASSAICRHRYSKLEMIRLAQAGIDQYRNWSTFTQLSKPRAQFVNDGVLWFTGSDTGWSEREHQRMAKLGIRTFVLDDAALREAFPALNPCIKPVSLECLDVHVCGEGGKHLLELDGGHIDPVNAAEDLLEACRAAGVDVRFRQRVVAMDQSGGRVTGVKTAEGSHIGSGCVVNAAGPWCNELYRAMGVEAPMPLRPVRIQIVYLDRTPELPGRIPVCADVATGIYFRTQNRGQQLLVGSVREEDDREQVDTPDDFLRVADDEFSREKLHLLQHRLPGLQLNRSIRSYCGLYTVNLADVHPVLGPYGPEGFVVANGFSGHGFKTAPAVGAMVAAQISGDWLAGEEALPAIAQQLAPGRSPIALDSRSVLA